MTRHGLFCQERNYCKATRICLQSVSSAGNLTAWPWQITRKERKGGKKNKKVPGLYGIAICWRKCKDRHAVWMQPTSTEPSRRQGGTDLTQQKVPCPTRRRRTPCRSGRAPSPQGFHGGTRATWNRNSLVSEIREFKPELVFSAVISQQAPAAEFAAVCVCARVCFCVCECAAATLLPSKLTV